MKKKYKNFFTLDKYLNLDNSPFYWISIIQNQFSQNMDNALKIYGLDNSRRQILLAIKSKNNASISDLSIMLVLKISTTTKIVHRLRDEGLVETYICPIDKRYTRIKLTKNGEFSVERINELCNIIIKQTLDGLAPIQIDETITSLKYISKKLQ